LSEVSAVYRAPFSGAPPKNLHFAHGMTLEAMVEGAGLPRDFREYGVIRVGGVEYAAQTWVHVKPRAGRVVTFHYMPLMGGRSRGGGFKAILGIVIAIATILTAGAAAAGAFSGLLGSGFAAGTIGAKVLGAGISVVGSLASAALSAPPVSSGAPGGPTAEQSRSPASIQGNILRPGMSIPRVVGTRRIYPPLACQPLTERIGQDEYAEGVCVLADPHDLADIRLGETLADEAEDVEIEIREGWPDDTPIGLVYRYGVTQDLRMELSSHTLLSTDFYSLANQVLPAASIPKFHSFTLSKNCDEIWGHLSFPGGLLWGADANTNMQIAFRLRMRAVGTFTWINLPEVHFTAKNSTDQKPHFKIIWGEAPPVTDITNALSWNAAYKFVLGQAIAPATDDWVAHAMFSAGAGNDGLYDGTEFTSNVRRTVLNGNLVSFYIDEAQVPKGEYQLEIKKSFPFGRDNFTKSTHQAGGNYDLFTYYSDSGNKRIPYSQEHSVARCFLMRIASVFNTHPIANGDPGSGLAILAVRTLNREIPNISVTASGYVKDWDGVGWNTWVYGGQYMAAHYRDILVGTMSPDPIDADVIDEDSLLDWRADCIANSYTCNLICEGARIDEVLNILASCGYARPGYSETWGVIRDYDRAAEDPVQIFNNRNASQLRMEKAFARSPDALRVNYKNADDLDQQREIIVFRPDSDPDADPRIEVVEYQGLTEEAAVVARAEYDLLQMDVRSVFWSFRAFVESIMCRRGDLIGVNHDVLDEMYAAARVDDVIVEGGNILGVVLDSEVPVFNETPWEDILVFEDEEDVELIGKASAISIRQSDGMHSQHVIAGATGERSTIMFETPAPLEADPDDGKSVVRRDSLVTIGQPGEVFMRLIVKQVTYDKNNMGSIVAVPEAPELWS
jgi:hypothetical protein